MTHMFWQEFAVLYAAALVGAAAILPYSLRMLEGKQLKLSTPVVLLLSFVQSAVLFGVAVAVGLQAAHASGFGAPYIEAILSGVSTPSATGLVIALALGVIAGAVLLAADLVFVPYWPPALRDVALKTKPAENLLASLYGGISEEILMRLFGFSALVWLLTRVWHTSAGGPTTAVLWIANVVMTILFGLGHLPALKNMLGTIPRSMFIRSLLLNAPVGLVCGWLFWMYGIEAAMIAHFSADIVYHVFGSFVLRRRIA